MKTNYKIKNIHGFETLITTLVTGEEAAMLIMPSMTEDLHSKTRMCIEKETGLSNISCKADFVRSGTVEEMNSPLFRKAALDNLRTIQFLIKNNMYEQILLEWLNKVPQNKIRVYFGGDLSLTKNTDILTKLIQAAAELEGKTVYIRTSLSKVVNELMLNKDFKCPDNVIIGVEHQLADELPLHDFTIITYTEDESAPDDFTSFPAPGTREYFVRITKEAKLCAKTGKPWWARFASSASCKTK